MGGFRFLFRALRHRNYRLFFGGQGVSLIGTWMQGTALGYLISELAGSERAASFWCAFIPAVGQLPTFLLPMFAGALADRYSRRRILLITQSLAAVQALILACLTFTEVVSIPQVLALAIFIGLVNSFDIPTRQSFTVEMVEDRADLGNAIALNSTLVNSARIFGPAIGGVLIAAIGEASCFFVNSLSYMAVLAALVAMKVRPRETPPPAGHVLHNIKEGFRYATGSRPIRTVLMLIATVSFMGVSYGTLMPVIAKQYLHSDSRGLGMLLSSVGVGAICGAAFLASRGSVRGIKNMIAIATAVFGSGLLAFSAAAARGSLWLSMMMLAVAGFGFIVMMSASNTFIQTIVDDDKRGRVMSFWTMSFAGMVPLGSFYTSAVAPHIGPVWTTAIGGVACLLAAGVFATQLPLLRRMTHPIYIRKGLIPDVALAGASLPPEEAGEPVQTPGAANGFPRADGNGAGERK